MIHHFSISFEHFSGRKAPLRSSAGKPKSLRPLVHVSTAPPTRLVIYTYPFCHDVFRSQTDQKPPPLGSHRDRAPPDLPTLPRPLIERLLPTAFELVLDFPFISGASLPSTAACLQLLGCRSTAVAVTVVYPTAASPLVITATVGTDQPSTAAGPGCLDSPPGSTQYTVAAADAATGTPPARPKDTTRRSTGACLCRTAGAPLVGEHVLLPVALLAEPLFTRRVGAREGALLEVHEAGVLVPVVPGTEGVAERATRQKM